MPKDADKDTLAARITEFVADVVTLDVITLTGDIKLVNKTVTYDEAKKKLNWNDLFRKVAEGMQPDSANKLEVVAYTHAEWDLDSVNFVKKDLSDSEKDLIAAHHSAVEAAQKSRFEAVRIIGDLLGV